MHPVPDTVPVADRRGRGPAVVLLHGQPGSAADWRAVVALLEADFTVIAPDRPGYGRTGGQAVGFAANAAAVIALLDELGLHQAVVAGHRWGGGVALALAEGDPDRVAGLVLAASVDPSEPVGHLDRLLAAPAVGDAVTAIGFAVTGRALASRRVRALVERRLASPARDALASLAGQGGRRSLGRSFLAEQRALVRELPGLAAGLASVRAPTVVLNGTADHVVPPASGRRLAAAIPGAVLVTVAGAGHLLPHDHPREVAAAILQVATGT